jgi:pimeloyl-ACP methyl ester carboxylesterase
MIRNVTLGALAFLLWPAGFGCRPVLAQTSTSAPVPPTTSATVDRWVGPAGHRVHAQVGGSGPTVVLVSGLGGSLSDWEDVAPSMRRFARVVSYDRPGLGKSDPGVGARTVTRMTTELEDMLEALGVPGPYILCGHSLGGDIAELYALRRPQEVSGLLLVDPASDEFFVRANATIPGFREGRAAQAEQRKRWPAGIRAEAEALDSSMAEMHGVGLGKPLPRVPMTMLIAGRHGRPPGAPLDSVRASPLEQLWRTVHLDWIRAQSLGHYVLDEPSGHYIQREDPTLVVGALRDLIAEITRH